MRASKIWDILVTNSVVNPNCAGKMTQKMRSTISKLAEMRRVDVEKEMVEFKKALKETMCDIHLDIAVEQPTRTTLTY